MASSQVGVQLVPQPHHFDPDPVVELLERSRAEGV